MGCQVHAIEKAIRPLFADRVTFIYYFIITGQTVILIVPRGRGRLQGKNDKREFTKGI